MGDTASPPPGDPHGLAGTGSSVFVEAEAAAGRLSERWQLFGLRGQVSGSANRRGGWNLGASERTRRGWDSRGGRLALLRRLWCFGDWLGDVNGRKRDHRGGEIETRLAGLRFRFGLDHLPR